MALPLQIYNSNMAASEKWPPVPCVLKSSGAVKKVSPPKPDTPPTPSVSFLILFFFFGCDLVGFFDRT